MEGDIRLGRLIPSISSPGTDLMEGYCRRHIVCCNNGLCMHNNKKLSTLILIGKVTKSPLHICNARITVLMVHKIPRVQEQ